jgi:hypothetical protein
MEEDEYRSTYNKLTTVRCVFEKALTNQQAKCALSKHFCLADREGYSCKNIESSAKCREVLELLRKNSIFVLKLREVNGPLPHNMEIRVQAGGIKGISKLIDEVVPREEVQSVTRTGEVIVKDISGVLNQMIEKYGSLEKLPYGEIIQSIVQFKVRRRRQH